jgi:hypothetical protein
MNFRRFFSETPGLFQLVFAHHPIVFVPKRLRVYRVPENLKSDVNRQRNSRLCFITGSNSPMASPIVAVLKPSGSVRLCVKNQYLNSFTIPDRIPLLNVLEVVQRI